MRRVAVLSLVIVAGCKPESLKLADELDRSSSWLATVVEVVRTTGENRTPRRFAEDAIADALDELAKAASATTGDGRRLIDEAPRHIAARDTAWLSAASDTLSDLAKALRR
jgi:hypothetical protein